MKNVKLFFKAFSKSAFDFCHIYSMKDKLLVTWDKMGKSKGFIVPNQK